MKLSPALHAVALAAGNRLQQSGREPSYTAAPSKYADEIGAAVLEEAGKQLLALMPTSWLDPLLIGENRVVGSGTPPFTCGDVGAVLNGLRERLASALRGMVAAAPTTHQVKRGPDHGSR